MFIDASALVAILNREAGYEDLVRRIGDSEGQLYTSPMVRFEASVGLARSRAVAGSKPSGELVERSAALVADFVRELALRDIHITSSIGDGAIRAAAEFGKGTGHPAELNTGDCFVYACARAYRLKLIYRGEEFSRTDIG
jgi:ribonuclease VapC